MNLTNPRRILLLNVARFSANLTNPPKVKSISHLDPLGPVHQGLGAIRVGPEDGEEGVALAEEVFLVQVLGC